jgi:hypothetical protein
MYAKIQDGSIIQTAKTLQELFPNISFSKITPLLLRNLGVQEVVQGTRQDVRFYTNTANSISLVDGQATQTYTSTAQSLTDVTSDGVLIPGLKSKMLTDYKNTANSLLASSDWKVIRKYERNVDIDSTTATFRAAVLTECTRLESAVNSASDIAGLSAITPNWPSEL